MKKSLILLTAFGLLTAFTLTGDFGKDIIGKWQIADSSLPVAKKLLIEKVRKMNPDQADQMESFGDQLYGILKTIVYEYKSDGTLEITTPQGPQTIKWSISSDNKYLLKTTADGRNAKDSIIDINKQKVVLYDLDSKVQVTYVPAQ